MTTIETGISVKTEFEGFHRWKDAPDEVAFLRDYHRHLFQVVVNIDTSHPDRQVEFFTFKKKLDEYLEGWKGQERKFDYSCEAVAKFILDKFPEAHYAAVSEDGENAGFARRVAAKPPEVEWDLNWWAHSMGNQPAKMWKYQPATLPKSDWKDWNPPPEWLEKLSKSAGEWGRAYAKLFSSQPPENPLHPNWFGPTPEPPKKEEKQYPCLIERREPFVGTEVEGPFRGTKNILLLPGCTKPFHQTLALRKYHELYGRFPPIIYMGAGNVRMQMKDNLHPGRVKWAIKTLISPATKLVVEFDVQGIQDIPHKPDFVKGMEGKEVYFVCHLSREFDYMAFIDKLRQVDYIKHIMPWRNQIVWTNPKDLNEYYVSKLDDPLFLEDKDL